MLTKFIAISALLTVMSSYAHAGQIPAQALENPHKSKDAIFRACKNEADLKRLTGDARSSFIALCVKK